MRVKIKKVNLNLSFIFKKFCIKTNFAHRLCVQTFLKVKLLKVKSFEIPKFKLKRLKCYLFNMVFIYILCNFDLVYVYFYLYIYLSLKFNVHCKFSLLKLLIKCNQNCFLIKFKLNFKLS